MAEIPPIALTLSSDQFYSEPERYLPSTEFRDIVSACLGREWTIAAKGLWTYCSIGEPVLAAGWKLHVSTRYEDRLKVLACITQILNERGNNFKYLSDSRILRLSLGKGWSRSQSGKFITIYPRSEKDFLTLADEIAKLTVDFVGPYILSDFPYPNSKVLYYRFGAHESRYNVDSRGTKVFGYQDAAGAWQEDNRAPIAALPSGVVDPVQRLVIPDSPSDIILADRYLISGVLKYNASGGVYFGHDKEGGRDIVVREQRLGMELPANEEGIVISPIERERHALQQLAGTGVVPEYVDFFHEDGNVYLVQERIAAKTLWGQTVELFLVDDKRTTKDVVQSLIQNIRAVVLAIKAIHSRGVIVRDLTRTNVLFDGLGGVKVVDFEFSFHEEQHKDIWLDGRTPGYASPNQIAKGRPEYGDDLYALGALIIDMIALCAPAIELSRSAVLKRVRRQVTDLMLPVEVMDLIAGLTEPTPTARWDLSTVEAALENIETKEILPGLINESMSEAAKGEISDSSIRDIIQMEANLSAGLHETKTLDNKVHLWPPSVDAFQKNGLCIEHGAAGVSFYLSRRGESLDLDVIRWIIDRLKDTEIPAGFYSGKAGLALLLLELSMESEAIDLISDVTDDSVQDPGLFYGQAGIGLVLLHFFNKTGERKFLSRAVGIANLICSQSMNTKSGVCWKRKPKTPIGLGEGQAGIALFLMYTGVASSERGYLDTSLKALDFDLSHVAPLAERSLWHRYVESKPNDPFEPHTNFGTAGIGSVCLRAYRVSGRDEYRDWANLCAKSVAHRTTNKLWQNRGHAGFGEFLLDCWQILGGNDYCRAAWHHAEALADFEVSVGRGSLIPGEGLFRLTSDYGMGSAGAGIFLDRLINNRGRLFFLDDMLEQYNKPDRPG